MPRTERVCIHIDLSKPEILLWGIPRGLLGSESCPFRVVVSDDLKWLNIRTAGTGDDGALVFRAGHANAGMLRVDWRSALAALVDKDRQITLTCWSNPAATIPRFWTVKASR